MWRPMGKPQWSQVTRVANGSGRIDYTVGCWAAAALFDSSTTQHTELSAPSVQPSSSPNTSHSPAKQCSPPSPTTSGAGRAPRRPPPPPACPGPRRWRTGSWSGRNQRISTRRESPRHRDRLRPGLRTRSTASTPPCSGTGPRASPPPAGAGRPPRRAASSTRATSRTSASRWPATGTSSSAELLLVVNLNC